MIGKKVSLSRESEKEVIIQELHRFGVYENLKGEKIETLSYHSLVHLLAVEQAIRK